MHRNLVVVGSTGAGKSSTCNTLFRSEAESSDPFEVSHDEVSSTKTIAQHLSKSKNLNIIDTPGFGDSRFTDRKINDSLSKLSSVFSADGSKIDAFVLVVRLTPRAQTLKRDLEHMRNVFGRAGLKSAILLLIYSGKRKPENGNFLEKLEKMEEISKMLKEGKQEEPSEDWFCLWDNINPREGQEEELLRKIEKLTPYTKDDFLKAQDQLSLANEVKPMAKLAHTVEDAPSIEDIDGNMKDLKDQSFSYAELEESMNKILEVMDMRQLSYKRRLDNVLKRNDEMFEKFMERVEELEKADKEKEKKKETVRLIRDIVCRKRRLGDEEKHELVGTTITEGAEKTAEKTAASIGTKLGEKIGQKGGERLQKSGDRVIDAMIH